MQLNILDQDGDEQWATHKGTPPQITSFAECIRSVLEGLMWNGRGPDMPDTEDTDVEKPSP